jgi:hypothetical protein
MEEAFDLELPVDRRRRDEQIAEPSAAAAARTQAHADAPTSAGPLFSSFVIWLMLALTMSLGVGSGAYLAAINAGWSQLAALTCACALAFVGKVVMLVVRPR